ncbi:MAG: TIGR02556 family CRISPR-associated protein [Calditrichaeota bacterium]|nr:TIGR02556 family CRISPR-associated protein [Calditrichota bacterium]
MLESLREIGRFSLEDQGKSVSDEISILLENPGSENYSTVIRINFDKTGNGELSYSGIFNEPISTQYDKYLYKRKGASGANYTPCALVAGKGLTGTFNNRILNWAKGNAEHKNIVGELARAIQKYAKDILRHLEQKEAEEGSDGIILTVSINNQHIGEIEAFRNYFVETYYESKKDIAHEQGVCSLCGTEGFVMGNVKPWAFYSLDKPGFIASGFSAKTGWKNFPICKKCSLFIEEGKQHVEDALNFRFAGIRYYLMPKSILGNPEVLSEALVFLEQERKKQLKTRDLKRLADEEDDILDFASEQSDALVYNFLFYESAKAKFTILLYLPDVLPSMIKKLFIAKETVENHSIFKEAYKEKDELKNIEFTFRNIRNFISNPQAFLNVVEKVFKRKPVDYFYLLSQFLGVLRQRFANEEFTRIQTLQAFQIILLLMELNILANKPKGELVMSNNLIQNEVKEKVEQFFKQFPDTFDTAEKRAVFLTGVLTQFLLNIQQRDRGSQPFRKNLKGLKMRQRDILQIFPEVQNKLEEYGENYYTQLEEVISEYFVRAGSHWNITDDEINFYFLLGMDLSNATTEDGKPIFKVGKEPIDESENNN